MAATKIPQDATPPTLAELQKMVTDAGWTLGVSWEMDDMIYAGSLEVIPNTYGHSRFEAHYAKESRWLHVGTNHKSAT